MVWFRESHRHRLAAYGIPSKYGTKSGTQIGAKEGGLRRNRTTVCRHPELENEPTFLSGGLAEGQNPERYDRKQLEIGTEVEMEHTNNPYIARRIAMDHLSEYPDYYKRLKAMEHRLERKKIRAEKRQKRKEEQLKRKKRGKK